jgi:hypothetical protein
MQMKRKLGGETTIKMTTYQDGVFDNIKKYMELYDVGFSVAVHDVVTAGFEAQERQLVAKTENEELAGEIRKLQIQLAAIEKATRDLGDVVFPEVEEKVVEYIKVSPDFSEENNSKIETISTLKPVCDESLRIAITPPDEAIYGPLKCFRCGEEVTGDESYSADANLHVHLADCTGGEDD